MSTYHRRKAGLDAEELGKHEDEILADFESAKFKSVDNLDEEMKAAKSAASGFMKRNARINIRVSEADLTMIKRLAVQEGIPYQTFLASMIHKVASGRIKVN